MMELKFGHPVLAWDKNENPVKEKYISKDGHGHYQTITKIYQPRELERYKNGI